MVSGSAAVADTNVQQDGAGDPSVQASLGSGTVQATGNVSLSSTLVATANSQTFGFAVGLVSGSASVANAILTPSVQTVIAGGSVTSSSGGISLQSLYNATPTGAVAGSGLGATAIAQASSGSEFLAGSGASTIATDGGITDASVQGGTLSASGGISLLSSSYASPTATSQGLAGGAIGFGATIATATSSGSTEANMSGSITGGASLSVGSLATESSTSSGQALSGGIVSGNAAQANSYVQQDGANDASAQASLGSGTVLVSGNITVGSQLTALANATATGLALGAVSAAGSVTNAILTPDVQTFITGGSVTSTAGGISLTSLYNANSNGASAGTGLGAIATSQASSGGLLAGSGANSTATDTGITDTNVDGGTLSAAGGITLLASSYASPTAKSTGIAGGAIGVGATIATATANGSTEANMNGTTNGASSLAVTALGTELAVDTSQALSGGLIAGNASQANAYVQQDGANDASVQASLGGGNVLASGNIAVSSDLNAEANATALGTALGALAASGSVTTATLTPLVQSFIAGGSVTSSSGGISLTSLYNANSTAPARARRSERPRIRRPRPAACSPAAAPTQRRPTLGSTSRPSAAGRYPPRAASHWCRVHTRHRRRRRPARPAARSASAPRSPRRRQTVRPRPTWMERSRVPAA